MRKLFDTIPTVLVQDPTAQQNYLIPAEALVQYTTSAATWAKMPESTVTFVIPDEDSVLEEIPPYVRDSDVAPSILIQHPTMNASYFLSTDDLDAFALARTPGPEDYGISFIMPIGMELIEQLPEVMKAPLQAGESGFRKMQWAKDVGAAEVSEGSRS